MPDLWSNWDSYQGQPDDWRSFYDTDNPLVEDIGLQPVGIPHQPTPTEGVTGLNTPPGTGGGEGGPGFEGDPFDFSGLASMPNFNLGAAPRFTAPRFHAPSAEEALNEPGYKFRLGEGERALEQSAAGRGTLRTGGTLKDILGWGQNFASNEYGQVYNRALSSFDRLYTGAHDEYAPLLAEWTTRAAASQRASELSFQREWDRWLASHLTAGQIFGAGQE